MHRWLVAGGLSLIVAACHATSFSPPDDGGGDDDDGGACTCQLPSSQGEIDIPCSSLGCAGGNLYACTASGTVLPSGPCGSSDAGFTEEGDCITTCTGQVCGVSDGCGGICGCAAGVPCNPNGTCGNGCDLAAGEACLLEAGSSTTCCASGYLCLTHDSGVDSCCVVVGGDGVCAQDTDCCDYPVARCIVSTGACGQ